MYRLFILLFLTGSVVSCKQNLMHSGSSGINDTLNALFEQYRVTTYAMYPEYATYNGVYDDNDRLNDQSLAFDQVMEDTTRAFREALLAIDREKLSSDQQLNYDLFLYQLDQDIAASEFKIANYLGMTQQNGYHITFPQIVQVQPLENDEDAVNYLKRLEAFPEQVNHLMDRLRKGKERGIMQPCTISQQVLQQLEGLAGMKYNESPLYQVVESHPVLQAREDQLARVLKERVMPAYQSLYIYYRDEYHPRCREEVGIVALPGGQEYYEFLVKQFTSSDQTPEQVFEIGMTEVDKIEKDIITTKAIMGFEEMELDEFFEQLRTSPDYYFEDKDSLMAGYRRILSRMDEQLPDLFGRLPKAPYDLKEIESYRAAAAPAAYYYPAPEDGSRPGYFYVNTYQLDARPIYSMTALALHEAVPGHHLQIALAQEMEDVPWFRNQMMVTAFVEGWGLYAEFLGYEAGMYDDLVQRMGALSFEMWRACRLVVDVGMHYKGWTAEQARSFMLAHVPLSELDVQSEIDRYISWPGQALAYKTGELKLKALRAKARSALGPKFDIKEFHDVVLANGSIPMSLLEEKVNEWIASKN